MTKPYSKPLSIAATANGYYPDSSGFSVDDIGGTFQMEVSGTFGGATVGLEYKGQYHSQWVSIAGAALTAAGSSGIDGAAGDFFRAVVSGATGTTNLVITAATKV